MSVTNIVGIRFLNPIVTRNRLASTGVLSSPRCQFLCLLSYPLVPSACLRFTSSSENVPSPLPGLWPVLRMEGLWTRASIEKNKELMEYLRHYGVIKSEKVAEVMEIIDRGLFVPDRCPPYSDSPMPIGYNGTISAPHMHATCLELLKDHLKSGLRALDVGSGSGYLSACFAMMVGPEGHAVGVEHIPELVAASVENINRSAAASLMEGGSLTVHVAGMICENFNYSYFLLGVRYPARLPSGSHESFSSTRSRLRARAILDCTKAPI
ncbi:protein-L-isoaspartate O-methyltransferase-like [Phalaenopsis equestris]|uniref:protein-L-isoaspartate O-methyltransferase-like n=1 Tax=Phalaenopsis equestris TaxID=78828 RepID=UPI0009E2F95C|nr:protein-L-isoaspartate O-methyltransferase-like [Phalaenopsis equestris]